MNKLSEVCVIITAKNNVNIIEECLDSIFAQSYKNISCIVTDDNSTDGTHELIRKKYPKVLFLVNKKGEGPAKNRNLALAQTRAPYVLFMDSDAVLEKDWLEKAVPIMGKKKNVGILGGKILNADGSIQAVGTFFHITGVSGFRKENCADLAEYLWWPSSTMLVRTEVIKNIGGFDDSYCYLYEDSDIGWRVNIAGFNVTYYEKLVSFHKMHTTVKKEFQKRRLTFLTKRNKMLTLLKNLEFKTLLLWAPLIFGFCAAEVFCLPYKLDVLRGLFAALKMLPQIIDKRKEIAQHRLCSDKDLSAYMSFSTQELIRLYIYAKTGVW